MTSIIINPLHSRVAHRSFDLFVKQEGQKFIHDEEVLLNLGNTLDRWILSFTQSLVLFVHQEMAGKSISSPNLRHKSPD